MANDVAGKKALPTFWLVVLLGSLTAFGPLSMDMYLPGLPAVAADLGASTSLVQLSLTACLVGLGAGQLLFGPLSDIYGRRKPLVFTLAVYAIASILCAISETIWLFILLRFVQGLTGAAGIVIARACARDMYAGHELTKFMALLSIVNGAAPILAPIAGGMILNYASWPVVFFVLAGIGLLMFAGTAGFLPDTLPAENRAEKGLLSVFKTFSRLLKDRRFMGIAFTQAFISASMFAYIAGSPFVLQTMYGVSPQQFSLFFALNGLGIIAAAQITGRLSHKVSESRFLLVGVVTSTIGGLLLLFGVWQQSPLSLIAFAFFIIVSSVGLVSPAAFSLAMQQQEQSAGSASAFLGLLPFVCGAIVSPLVGIAGDQTAWPLGITILVCSLLALIICLLLMRSLTGMAGQQQAAAKN